MADGVKYRPEQERVADRILTTISLVDGFDSAGNERAEAGRAAILDLLHNHPAPFDPSSYEPGHITASAVVLSSNNEQLLLVYHQRLARWLQPGGHVEPGDRDVIETARRELSEETGVKLDTAVPTRLVGIDVHEIPATESEPLHLHHDLTFAFTVDEPESVHQRGTELALWFQVDQLDSCCLDDPLRRSLRKAMEKT